MSWCRLEDTFHDEAKWHRIADLLNIYWVTAAGHVACLYSWAARHAKDGDLRDFDASDIERAMGWNGQNGALFSALQHKRVGIIERGRHGFVIHRYFERAESFKAAQKKRRQRGRDANCPETEREAVPEQRPGPSRDSPEKVPREREEREERDPPNPPKKEMGREGGLQDAGTEKTEADIDAFADHWRFAKRSVGVPVGRAPVSARTAQWARNVMLGCEKWREFVLWYVSCGDPWAKGLGYPLWALESQLDRFVDLWKRGSEGESLDPSARAAANLAETEQRLKAHDAQLTAAYSPNSERAAKELFSTFLRSGIETSS